MTQHYRVAFARLMHVHPDAVAIDKRVLEIIHAAEPRNAGSAIPAAAAGSQKGTLSEICRLTVNDGRPYGGVSTNFNPAGGVR